MDALGLEIIEPLSDYLGYIDILNLSLASRAMWELYNSDIFWIRRARVLLGTSHIKFNDYDDSLWKNYDTEFYSGGFFNTGHSNSLNKNKNARNRYKSLAVFYSNDMAPDSYLYMWRYTYFIALCKQKQWNMIMCLDDKFHLPPIFWLDASLYFPDKYTYCIDRYNDYTDTSSKPRFLDRDSLYAESSSLEREKYARYKDITDGKCFDVRGYEENIINELIEAALNFNQCQCILDIISNIKGTSRYDNVVFHTIINSILNDNLYIFDKVISQYVSDSDTISEYIIQDLIYENYMPRRMLLRLLKYFKDKKYEPNYGIYINYACKVDYPEIIKVCLDMIDESSNRQIQRYDFSFIKSYLQRYGHYDMLDRFTGSSKIIFE